MAVEHNEQGPIRRFISRIDIFGGRIAILSSLAGANKDPGHTTYQPVERPDRLPAPGSEEVKKSGVEAMQEAIAKNPPGFILYETAEVEKVDKTPDDIPMEDYIALNSHQDIAKGLEQFGFPTDQVGRMTRQAVRKGVSENELHKTHD